MNHVSVTGDNPHRHAWNGTKKKNKEIWRKTECTVFDKGF